MQKADILVVDDDAFFRTLSSDILRNGGYNVNAAPSGAEALKIIEKDGIDIVITDLMMPGIGGIELLERTKQHNTLIDVIVVTGHGSIETAINALKKGAFDYIRKPLNEEELLHTVEACLEKRKLLAENQEMRQSLNLFEVTRTITTTLDVNKLYNMTLDAMLQIVQADSGILVFYDNAGANLEIRSIRHIEITEGEKIASAFKGSFERDLKNLGNITIIGKEVLDLREPEAFMGTSSILVAPLSRGGSTIGFILLLGGPGKRPPGARDTRNAAFVVEHASQAFENAHRYDEAKEMAFVDSLTNLYNAKYLEGSLDKELKRADRLMMPVSVLFLDLDNFKRINDTNDHLIGSRVLVEVAKILLLSVREVDTVVRYGGDEYVVVLVDADFNSGFKVADRIRASIENHSFLKDEGLDIRITASIGLATYPVHTKDKKELLKIADKAMYRAKDISRNLVYLAPIPGSEAAVGK